MLEELKTFISVVELNNFTKAGEHLNLSQPSVSTHIKNLESYFGVTLIHRSVKKKKISISESGYTLYKRAKEIINLIELTCLELKDNNNDIKGHLRVGSSLTIGEYLLPEFISIFSKKYPDVIIDISIENTTSICSKLKEMKIDVGLIEGNGFFPEFIQNHFFEDKMVLITPYIKDIDYSLNYINEFDNNWIIREDGSGTREITNSFFNSNNIIPKKVLILGSNYAIKETVKNNLGISIISSLVAKPASKNNELSLFFLDDSYSRYFSYIILKDINLPKCANIFLEELKFFSKNLT